MVCRFFRFRDQEFLPSQKRQNISCLSPLLVPWLSIFKAKLNDTAQIWDGFAGNMAQAGREEQMGDEIFRNKVTWFSFVFSLLVIWVHSYNAGLYLDGMPQMAAVYRLQHGIGDGIGQVAVPGFFMISGYLFYRDFTWSKLGEKWNRRIRSILVPYILWNFLYYMGYVIGSRLPWMTDVVGKGRIPFQLSVLVDAVINYTYNYVFWYLFQLILLVMLAPVLYPVLRCPWSRIGTMAAFWWLIIAGKELPLLNVDALIYYSTAASFALAKTKWVEEKERGHTNGKFYTAGGFGLLAVAVILYRVGLHRAWISCFALCRLLAVAGLWMAIPGNKLPKARDFMCHNFFLYGVHFAFVRFINKAGTRILPAVPAVPLLLYIFMPVLILGIATVLGSLLRRYLPVTWMLLNGGR